MSTSKKFILLLSVLIITIIWSRLNWLVFPIVILLFSSIPIVYYYRKLILPKFSSQYRNLICIGYLLYALSLMVFSLKITDLKQIILIACCILLAIIVGIVFKYFYSKNKKGKTELKNLMSHLYVILNFLVLLLLISNKNLFS